MRLRRGLALACPSKGIGPLAVTKSTGTEPLDGGPGTCARDDWRPLDGDDRAALRLGAPETLTRSMVLLDLGPDVLAEAQRELLPLTVADPDRSAEAEAEAIRRVHSRVVSALALDFGLTPDHVGAADLVVHQPGLRSTARDPSTGRHLGLHIDSHQRLPFGDRPRAMTLCALNIGFTIRSVCFVNLAVADLVTVLEEVGAPVPESANELRDAFFSLHPDYPVLRAELAPGQAYLCNTQNVIHDGQTNDEGLPDISFLTLNDLPDVVPIDQRVA